MIYHNKQSGVTLLIAMIILAIVSAITLVTANTFFTEFRLARDLQSTEPVAYATQSFLELALFKVQRSLPENIDSGSTADDLDALSFASPTGAATSACASLSASVMCSSKPTDIPGDVSTNSKFNEVETKNIGRFVTGEVPLFDVVFCNLKSALPVSNTPDYCTDNNVYELYNPDDPFAFDSGYKRIGIKNVSGTGGNDVKAMLCPSTLLTYKQCRDAALSITSQDSDPKKYVHTIDIPSSSTNVILIPSSTNLYADTNYSLYMTSSGSGVNDRKVQIFSYGQFGNETNLNDPSNIPKGLPYFAGVRVRMDGKYQDILRSYQSVIPKPY